MAQRLVREPGFRLLCVSPPALATEAALMVRVRRRPAAVAKPAGCDVADGGWRWSLLAVERARWAGAGMIRFEGFMMYVGGDVSARLSWEWRSS